MRSAATVDLLLIDGGERSRRALSAGLTKHGLAVASCRSAQEAQRLLAELRPRSIVTELRLPDGCGLQLLSKLKRVVPDATVIMLTGYASIATAIEAIRRGAANYLVKPATPEQIIASLKAANDPAAEPPPPPQPLPIERVEWEYINWVLMEHDGNLSAAARSLSMHRRTLQRKLKKRPRRV